MHMLFSVYVLSFLFICICIDRDFLYDEVLMQNLFVFAEGVVEWLSFVYQSLTKIIPNVQPQGPILYAYRPI